MNAVDWQTPIAAALVLLCAGFTAWRLAPAVWRQRMALRLGMAPAATAAGGACGGGCDGCAGGASADPKGSAPHTSVVKIVRPLKHQPEPPHGPSPG
jgi:hypothetical protein